MTIFPLIGRTHDLAYAPRGQAEAFAQHLSRHARLMQLADALVALMRGVVLSARSRHQGPFDCPRYLLANTTAKDKRQDVCLDNRLNVRIVGCQESTL